jgi:hypothetical protein
MRCRGPRSLADAAEHCPALHDFNVVLVFSRGPHLSNSSNSAMVCKNNLTWTESLDESYNGGRAVPSDQTSWHIGSGETGSGIWGAFHPLTVSSRRENAEKTVARRMLCNDVHKSFLLGCGEPPSRSPRAGNSSSSLIRAKILG